MLSGRTLPWLSQAFGVPATAPPVGTSSKPRCAWVPSTVSAHAPDSPPGPCRAPPSSQLGKLAPRGSGTGHGHRRVAAALGSGHRSADPRGHLALLLSLIIAHAHLHALQGPCPPFTGGSPSRPGTVPRLPAQGQGQPGGWAFYSLWSLMSPPSKSSPRPPQSARDRACLLPEGSREQESFPAPARGRPLRPRRGDSVLSISSACPRVGGGRTPGLFGLGAPLLTWVFIVRGK